MWDQDSGHSPDICKGCLELLTNESPNTAIFREEEVDVRVDCAVELGLMEREEA